MSCYYDRKVCTPHFCSKPYTDFVCCFCVYLSLGKTLICVICYAIGCRVVIGKKCSHLHHSIFWRATNARDIQTLFGLVLVCFISDKLSEGICGFVCFRFILICHIVYKPVNPPVNCPYFRCCQAYLLLFRTMLTFLRTTATPLLHCGGIQARR